MSILKKLISSLLCVVILTSVLASCNMDDSHDHKTSESTTEQPQETNPDHTHGETKPNEESTGSLEEHTHTPASAVTENFVDSTCTAAGSYDEVVCCSVCEDEISRTQKALNKKPHDHSQKVATTEYLKTEATCTDSAIYYYSCSCGDKGTASFRAGEPSEHLYNQKVVADKYLKTSADCKSAAVYYYSCACGEKGETTFASGSVIPHTFDQRNTASVYRKSPATCTEVAVYYYSCACGEKGEITFASGSVIPHTFDQKIASATYLKSNATCQTPAKYYYSCSCGEKGVSTFSHGALGEHEYNQRNTAVVYRKSSATETSPAVYYYSCICGDKGTNTFTSGGTLEHTHNFNQKNTAFAYRKSPATCIDVAVYYYSCACGEKGTSTFTWGTVTSHTFDQKNTAATYRKSSATCTEAAVYYYSCACGEKGETTFASGSVIPHTFVQKNMSSIYIKSAATCTEAAVYYYSCSCGEKGANTFASGAVIPHTFGEWIVDTAATCTKAGTRHHVCTICQKSVRETYSNSNAHNYDTAWTVDDTHHWHRCLNSGCSSVYGKAAHNFTDEFCTGCCVKYVDKATYTRDGNYIYFGEYPQSLKADNVTITANMDVRGYYVGSDGYYYAKVWGKTFTPLGGPTPKFVSGELIQSGKVYYFKVDPIRWRILSETGDTALILCDSIIANRAYNDTRTSTYEGSSIRAWLNDQFYNTVFSVFQKDLINTVLIDNDSGGDTLDKVFLLKLKDVINPAYGFASSEAVGDTARLMIVSEYARATGTQMCSDDHGYWMLGEAHFGSYADAMNVLLAGEDGRADSYSLMTGECFGVVPALQIRLSGEKSYVDTTGLMYRVNEDGISCTIASIGTCTETEIVIPTEIDGMKVTHIGDSAFWGCTLTSITLPDSVTNIGKDAFGSCKYLTSINFGKNSKLISIGSFAFDNCTNLRSIAIPESVTTIGEYAFNSCRVHDVYITDIAAWCEISFGNSSANPCYSSYPGAFYLNGELVTDLVIPPSVTSIKNYAFKGCYSLTSVVIPNSVTSIGDYAFYDCFHLESVTIPNSVTMIGVRAFMSCDLLTSINLEENSQLTTIGESAFKYCYDLASITIPDSVTSIGDEAFYQCTSLNSITISSSVTSIGNKTFYGCQSLISITIPASVTSINNEAFYNCASLNSIIISNSMTNIGDKTFYGCTNLTSIKYCGTEGQWDQITKGANWNPNNGIYTITYNC